MNKIIITAIGTDEPGLVDKISSIINQNEGNIENSKMIKVCNQFAMIIDFSYLHNIDIIKTELGEIKDLEVTYRSVHNLGVSKKYYKKYIIKGADDQGIVNKVSNFFSNHDINIIEIDTFLESAPITGAPLFNMKITISYNKSNNMPNIDSELINLCDNLNLDIKIL